MEAFVVDIINRFGYLGIYFLIALESIFPPLPAESVLMVSGFAAYLPTVEMNPWLLILAATLGALTGALFAYSVGRLLTRKRLDAWLRKYFPRLILLRRGLNKTFYFFRKHDHLAIFLGRYVPVVRPLISWTAGVLDIRLGTFVLFSALGAASLNTFYVFLGSVAGRYKQQMWAFFLEYPVPVLIVGGLGLLAFSFYWLRRWRDELLRRQRRKARFKNRKPREPKP